MFVLLFVEKIHSTRKCVQTVELFSATPLGARTVQTPPADFHVANMNINRQLDIMGDRLCKRMEKLELTPRIIQQTSGLALNSVKTAMLGKKCNVGTLAKICTCLGWTLFDLFHREFEDTKDLAVEDSVVKEPELTEAVPIIK